MTTIPPPAGVKAAAPAPGPRRRFRRFIKRVVFAAVPVLVLLGAAEGVLRVKYFLLHKHDWNYLTMPFRVQDFQAQDHSHYIAPEPATPPQQDLAVVSPEKGSAAPSPEKGSAAPSPEKGSAAPSLEKGSAATPPEKGPAVPSPEKNSAVLSPEKGSAASTSSATALGTQVKYKWLRPCRDREVYSEHYQKLMPFTWDANCFRGDAMTQHKRPDEFRVFVMGGSTVEDAQPDVDMWTTQLKNTLHHPRIRVVNAGHSDMGSIGASQTYVYKIRHFFPDVVLYYEAWNEQAEFSRWAEVDRVVAHLIKGAFEPLYYRSALYTYIVEKYAFSTAKQVRFWKIDVVRLQRNLEILSTGVDRSGARLVFVTQVIDFPRSWKGIDTFDPNAVDGLLGRLQHDPSYQYDLNEISALNQRLAVFRSIETYRRLNVRVINILDEVEALGETARRVLFVDLGHLSWQGDSLVGSLVGNKLKALDLLPAIAQ